MSCRKQANVYLQRSCVSNLLRDGVIYKACFYRKLKQCHTFARCRKKFGWLENNKSAVHKVVNFFFLPSALADIHSTTNSLLDKPTPSILRCNGVRPHDLIFHNFHRIPVNAKVTIQSIEMKKNYKSFSLLSLGLNE